MSIGIISSSCRKEEQEENITFQNVSEEVFQLMNEQKTYMQAIRGEIETLENVDNFVSPALKENLNNSYSQAQPYLEKFFWKERKRLLILKNLKQISKK